MLVVIWITVAYFLGFAARPVGLPPLVGYLAAGFILHSINTLLSLPKEGEIWLEQLAHLGVLLLMFTIGLKLRASSVVRTEILGSGLIHFVASTLIFGTGFLWLLALPWTKALLLGAALSFSSTVLAAKILDGKRELRAFHGRAAIGILILQDVIALLIMAFGGEHSPSPWALGLIALPLLRPLLYRLLDISGHDELLVLLGLLLAVVLGGYGFEHLGLSSELGALVFGMLLARHKRAVELSHSLWGIKEIFLVGFFLQIGVHGLPDTKALAFALVMVALLPLKTLLYFLLLVAFKLRARSAFLASLSLGNYSEFSLIMASVLIPEWMVPLAISLALSFVISAPLNRIAHPLYERLARRLIPLERNIRHPDQQPVSLGNARVLVIGMGRTGTAAYEHLARHAVALIALDSDLTKVEQQRQLGRNIEFADAEDQLFWQEVDLRQLDSVILSMNDVESKVIAAQQLRRRGFKGMVLSHSIYPDDAEKINAAGANKTYQTMSQAGVGLAEHLLEAQHGIIEPYEVQQQRE
jgi:predicted Kef-type K+ transport protein